MSCSIGSLSRTLLKSYRYVINNAVHTRCQSSQRKKIRKSKQVIPNAGIQKRLKAGVIDDVDYEYVDDVESDFMNANELHSEHEREMQELKERNRLKIVQSKYFKTAGEPKLITWEEMEQIRYLHHSDADEWSVEKLAMSFPVSEAAVKRILKANWKPASSQRIMQYNKSVEENWKLLEKGKLELPEDLKLHLSKFASRKLVALPNPNLGKMEKTSSIIPNENSEFGSIISSYKALKEKESLSVQKSPGFLNISTVPEHMGSFIVEGNKRVVKTHGNAPMTLDKYRSDILNFIESGHKASAEDKVMLANYTNKTNLCAEESRATSKAVDNASVMKDKYAKNSVQTVSSKIGTLIEVKHPPDRIKIPKKGAIEGGLYKVEDCYYDDDGEFLYRVPGMKS